MGEEGKNEGERETGLTQVKYEDGTPNPGYLGEINVFPLSLHHPQSPDSNPSLSIWLPKSFHGSPWFSNIGLHLFCSPWISLSVLLCRLGPDQDGLRKGSSVRRGTRPNMEGIRGTVQSNTGSFVSAVLAIGVCKTTQKNDGTATFKARNWRDHLKLSKRIELIPIFSHEIWWSGG